MNSSRLKTFCFGLAGGLAYALLAMLIVRSAHRNVSNAFIFGVPVMLGAIPVFFSSKEGLRSYRDFLIIPIVTSFSFFLVCLTFHFDGMICLTVIVAPFVLLGCLAAFLYRMAKLRSSGKGTPLYATLLLPILLLWVEFSAPTSIQTGNVISDIGINAPGTIIWENIKNVRDIGPREVRTHFIHFMGIPKPLDGRLDKEGIGGTRRIIWEKGIRFRERITSWIEARSFAYDIDLDPASVPLATLDDHVMVGGEYFGVTKGGYRIDSLAPSKFKVTLTCGYRVSTTLNWYSSLWARFVLNQLNDSILEVIKKRCESEAGPGSE